MDGKKYFCKTTIFLLNRVEIFKIHRLRSFYLTDNLTKFIFFHEFFLRNFKKAQILKVFK
jgi:hypothetical protein